MVYVQNITDSGYARAADGTEPVPEALDSAEESQSELWIYVFAVVQGSCADSWHDIEATFEEKFPDEEQWKTDGRLVEMDTAGLSEASDDLRILYAGWQVQMHDLASEDDVVARVLEPLEAALRELG